MSITSYSITKPSFHVVTFIQDALLGNEDDTDVFLVDRAVTKRVTKV